MASSFAKRTNSIGGGAATGLVIANRNDPERVELPQEIFDPFRVAAKLELVSVGVAHGY